MMLLGQDREKRLAEVRADARAKFAAMSIKYARNLSYAEVYAQMVLALEDMARGDAEHIRRYGVALGEHYCGPDGRRSPEWWMANVWNAAPEGEKP